MSKFIWAFLLSLLLSVIALKICIPLLKRFKLGQPILSYVKEHSVKSGTPTMAGLVFITTGIISFLFFVNGSSHLAITLLVVTLSFMIVGLIDDVIKIKYSDNQGLTPIKKTLFQLAIAVITSIVTYNVGDSYAYIPFTNILVNLGVFSIILNVVIFIATVNSVNLTDGLDGLSGGVSFVYLLGLTVITILEVKNNNTAYLNVSEFYNVCLLNVSVAGSILGFLLFNTNKASIFMGDSGSLALGGLIACSSIFTLNSLLIPILGIMFLISSLSVIIQVIYFKRTKKRVFLMSPIHHHFQQKGHNESKIAYAYALITLVMALLLIAFILP